MTDHITNPGHHRGPFADLTDEQLRAGYERVAIDPDDASAPVIRAELIARGLIEE